MIAIVKFPMEPFNTMVKDGSIAEAMGKIMEAIKPSSAYFIEEDGRRCGILAVECPTASDIPRLAEPWFLTFNATVQLRAAMTVEDLMAANLVELGKQWG
jgi:6-phosphofructokinase